MYDVNIKIDLRATSYTVVVNNILMMNSIELFQ